MELSTIQNGVALSCASETGKYLKELEALVRKKKEVVLDYEFIYSSPFKLDWDRSSEITVRNIETWAKSVGFKFAATGINNGDSFLLVCPEE